MFKKLEKLTVVDSSTGEVLSQVVRSVRPGSDKEPGFVKMYGEGVLALIALRGFEQRVLKALLDEMGYRNDLVLSNKVVLRLAEGLGLKVQSIRRVVYTLREMNVLYKEESKNYLVNPFMFAKSRWKDNKPVRDVWSKVERYCGKVEEGVEPVDERVGYQDAEAC